MLDKNNCYIFVIFFALGFCFYEIFVAQLYLNFKQKYKYMNEQLKRQIFACPSVLIDDAPVCIL